MTLVTIAAAAVGPPADGKDGTCRMGQADKPRTTFQLADGSSVGRLVEVAHDDDERMSPHTDKRVADGLHHRGSQLPEGFRGTRAAQTTGPVADEDVEGVAREQLAADVQHGAGMAVGTKPLDGYGMLSLTEQPEVFGAVEQGHIDAARIVAVRHHITVACATQRRAPREVAETAVVLDLAEPHQLGSPVSAYRGDDFSHTPQFLHVAPGCPTTTTVRQIVEVARQAVMTEIEQVLGIIEDDAQASSLPRRRHRGKRDGVLSCRDVAGRISLRALAAPGTGSSRHRCGGCRGGRRRGRGVPQATKQDRQCREHG